MKGNTFTQIGEDLQKENPDVSVSKMFGMPAIKIGKNAFSGEWEGSMVFKLAADSPEHTSALKLAGAKLFDPMGGRPMREWVVVPPSNADNWLELARAALQYVSSKQSK